MNGAGALARLLGGLTLLAGPASLIAGWGFAPYLVALADLSAMIPLARAWRAARGTQLRPAIAWGVAAAVLGMASQFAAAQGSGPGVSAAGHLTYLNVLASLAALLSVLNARTPGGGAWAILMALLVLVLLIPWLEGPRLGEGHGGVGRLRLESPWDLFYGVVVLAGVTNFLPTRYGPAAACLAVGFAVEWWALSRSDLAPAWRGRLWSVPPFTLALASWVAAGLSRRPSMADSGLGRAWLWFRDHWGVVWGLRVAERFNRAAERAGWPFRLGWYGPAGLPGAPPPGPSELQAAEATLLGLLRRFGDPGRIVEVATGPAAGPCQSPDAAR